MAVIEYRLISEPPADVDVEAAFEWYENQQPGLGLEFLDELRAAYNRIVDGPLKYQELRGAIRTKVRCLDGFTAAVGATAYTYPDLELRGQLVERPVRAYAWGPYGIHRAACRRLSMHRAISTTYGFQILRLRRPWSSKHFMLPMSRRGAR